MTAPPDTPETPPLDRHDRDTATGRFLPGNPGRPKGARHAALAALDAIGEENAREVMQSVIEAAKGGDMRAADILLRRLWPERKGRPVSLVLPELQTAADAVRASSAVAAAMAEGTITPEEAQAAAAVLEGHRRTLETAELERRIAAIEARQNG